MSHLDGWKPSDSSHSRDASDYRGFYHRSGAPFRGTRNPLASLFTPLLFYDQQPIPNRYENTIKNSNALVAYHFGIFYLPFDKYSKFFL
jgi:hypothetical protein